MLIEAGSYQQNEAGQELSIFVDEREYLFVAAEGEGSLAMGPADGAWLRQIPFNAVRTFTEFFMQCLQALELELG